MAETKMNVELMFHTQLSAKFKEKLQKQSEQLADAHDGKILALTAIRTCYSANRPSEIAIKEGAKYFGSAASDGDSGSDADRLIRQIVASKHTSTLEGITFTFAIEGVSRALLAQLTRHRVGFSFSVQSQRYVRMGSGVRTKTGHTIACPPSMAFGTRLNIEDIGVRTCEDRGGAITEGHIDLYVAGVAEAQAFGRQRLKAEIITK